MSRTRFFVLLASVVPAVVAACSGDDTVAPNPTPDGGSDATVANDGPPLVDTAPPDIGVPPDTGTSRLIQCGQATCNAASQDCCIGGGAGISCQNKGTCPASSLSCSDKASCTGGELCCATVERADGGADAGDDAGDGGDGGGGGIVAVHADCAAACTKGQVQLCSDTSECAAGEECRRGANGLKICRRIQDAGADASLDAPADG